MRSARFGRTLAVVTWLLAAILTLAALPLAAQTADTPAGHSAPARVQETTADRYGAWGWIGLIGLLGLAGLMRRDSTHRVDRAADRAKERMSRP
jgi:hypothetical protein